MKKTLHWLPRVIGILIVAFFALFILEGFGPGFGWRDSLAHSFVALVALAALVFSWKWPDVGGWAFVIFGVWYGWQALGDGQFLTASIIGGAPLIAGVLFIIEGVLKNSGKPAGK